jgi:hypothetical protein
VLDCIPTDTFILVTCCSFSYRHCIDWTSVRFFIWVRHSTRSKMKSSTRNDMTLAIQAHSVARTINSTRRRTSSKTNLPIWHFLLVHPTWSEPDVIPVLCTVNPAFKRLDFFIAVSQKVPKSHDYQLQAVFAIRYHQAGIFVNLGSFARKRILVPWCETGT